MNRCIHQAAIIHFHVTSPRNPIVQIGLVEVPGDNKMDGGSNLIELSVGEEKQFCRLDWILALG
eukprot:scaffold713_cov131-Cylindrotheca_fusiformis.AAC.18